MDKDDFIFLTCDNQTIVAPNVIKNMCALLMSNEFPNNEVNLSGCKIATAVNLNILLTFCKNHSYKNPEIISVPIQTQLLKLSKIDEEFISNLSFDLAVDLIKLSSKLECNSLEELCYAHMAVIIRSN